MTRAELEEAVRAILLEQMGGPQVLSLDLPQVQVTDADRLDTGNPRDRVWTHDLLTLSQSPRLGRDSWSWRTPPSPGTSRMMKLTTS